MLDEDQNYFYLRQLPGMGEWMGKCGVVDVLVNKGGISTYGFRWQRQTVGINVCLSYAKPYISFWIGAH